MLRAETADQEQPARRRSFSPGSLLTSHVSCFLEMLVQLRSRLTGCLLMMPLRAWGTKLVRFWFRTPKAETEPLGSSWHRTGFLLALCHQVLALTLEQQFTSFLS